MGPLQYKWYFKKQGQSWNGLQNQEYPVGHPEHITFTPHFVEHKVADEHHNVCEQYAECERCSHKDCVDGPAERQDCVPDELGAPWHFFGNQFLYDLFVLLNDVVKVFELFAKLLGNVIGVGKVIFYVFDFLNEPVIQLFVGFVC